MANERYEQILGNLLYYPKSPDKLIFFNTLSDKDGYNISRGLIYHLNAQRIYRQGMLHLNDNTLSTGFLKKGSEDYINKIKYIKEFLQQAITYEKTNELNYFKQKRDLILKIFKQEEIQQDDRLLDLVNFLQDASNEITNFDYDAFIILINSLLQGKNFTQKTITYLHNRMEELLTMRDLIIDSIVQQLKEQNEVKELSENLERRYVHLAKKKIRLLYLKNKRLTGEDGTALGHVIKNKIQPTIDVKFAAFINNCVTTIWNDKTMQNTFLNLVRNYYTRHPDEAINVSISSALKQVLTDTLLNYVGKNMDSVIDAIFSSATVQDILTSVTNLLQQDLLSTRIQVRGMPSHRFWTTELAYFDQTLKDTQKSAGLFKIVDKFYRNYKREMKKIASERQITSQQTLTYKALGLVGSTETVSRPEDDKIKEAITFIRRLQSLINTLRNRSKRLSKEKKAEGIKHTLNAGTKYEKTFIFTFDAQGRIQIPDGFLEYLDSRYLHAREILPIASSGAKSLETYLGVNTQRMNREFKRRLDNIKADKTKQKLLSAIHESLREVKMNVTGPTISELLAGLQVRQQGDGLVLYWPGYHNNKNDFVSISMNFNDQKLSMQLRDVFSSLVDTEINGFTETIIKNRQQAALNWQKEFEAKMLEQKNNGAGYHNYEEKRKAFFDAYDNFRALSSKTIDQLNQIYLQTRLMASDKTTAQKQEKARELIRQKYEKLKYDLLHSFYRSDTMKTYNEYQGNVGFVGGSIGTNLQEQLNSIAMIFKTAGAEIGDDELSLLYDLILNTNRNTIIKTKYRRTIETYLGAVAAFMLFDEGGAEVQILREQITGKYTRTINPDILHLYRLNGIYYPGSFILSETLRGVEELDTALNKLERPNGGTTIRITNTVSAADIPKFGTDSDPWRTMSRKVTENLNILRITFLAGMINILDNLLQRMNDIVIP